MHHRRRHFRVIAFDLTPCYRYISSVAYARATQNFTKYYWKPYTDNGVLNAIYGVFRWKGGPGTVEISQDLRAIENIRDEYMRQYWQAALEHLQRGPHAFIGYMEGLDEIKQYNLEAVRAQINDAGEINRDIAEETETGIRRLALIRLTSTVFIAVASAGLGIAGEGAVAATAAGISMGYNVIGTFAKDLASGKHAEVICMKTGEEAGKQANQEMASKIGEYAAQKFEAREEAKLASEHTLIQQAERKIKQLSEEIARKVSHKKIAKLSRQAEEIERTELAPAKAAASTIERFGTAARLGGKVLPLIFAAQDVIEGIEEFNETAGEE